MRYLCLLIFCTSGFAHDMWLQADAKTAAMQLVIGEKLVPEEVRALGLERATRFDAFIRGTESSLKNQPAPKAGGVVFMERAPNVIRLDAAKFNAYLAEEGHLDVLRSRVESRKHRNPARERYTRHLKLLLPSGASNDDYNHVFGGRLEIVPLSDVTAAAPAGDIELLVLFEGKPLPDVRVGFYNGKNQQEQRADETGRVRFTIAEGGPALARTTFLRPCSACTDADYESFWATLSFVARGAIQK